MTSVLPEASEQDELWNILHRKQQLQNRLQFLKQIQRKSNITEGSRASEEGPSELERVEEELKQVEEKEKELVKNKKKVPTNVKAPQTTDPSNDTGDGKASMQAFYVLPFNPIETISSYLLEEEEETEPPKAPEPVVQEPKTPKPEPPKPPKPPEKTINVEDLGMSPSTVKCPSCQKVIITEINHKLSSNAFLFCCLISVVGCVAGCCLVPFCMKRFKDVTHRCSSCHKKICDVSRI